MMDNSRENMMWPRSESCASAAQRGCFSVMLRGEPATGGHCRSIALMIVTLVLVLGFVAGPAWGWDSSTPNNPEPGPPPPPPCDEPCCDGEQSGNPINYYTGAERPRYTDLVVKGEFSIRFGRRYDSQSTYDSPMGYGWSNPHNRRLYEYPDNSVILRHGCGHRSRMVYSAGAYVVEPGGLRGTLEEQGDGSYIFTYLSGRKDYFDVKGRLAAAEDKHGNRLEYSYSATRQPLVGTSPYGVNPSSPITVAMVWQLQSIQERLADGTLTGNKVTLSYSATTGRLQSVSAQDGRTVTYTHDELDDGDGHTLTAGNLIKVEGLEGVVSSYKYEDSSNNHHLTGLQKDSQAEWVNNTYTNNRVTLQTYGNETTTFNYVADYIETKATVTVTDENGANPVDATDHFCFDDVGYVTEHEDAEGYLTVSIRNSDYLVTRKERWSRASDSADIVCNTATDTANRTLVHAVVNSYNTDGRILTRTEDRGDGQTITTTRTYDGAWVASQERVSSDDATTIFRTEYTFYYDGSGNPTNIKDVIRKRSAADGGDQTTTYTYNSRGQTTKITYQDNTSLNLDYAGGSLYPTRRFWKDASGVPIADLAEDYTYDNQGNVKTVTDADGKITSYDYDERNRLIKATNHLGEQTIYTYDQNNLVQIEVGHFGTVTGEIQKRVYDGKNRISQMQIQKADASWLTTATYAYDSSGRRLSVTDANSNVTRFGYDKLGRMTSLTDAELKTALYEYNALGQRTKSTQTSTTPNTVTNYSYDNQGNLLTVTDPNSHVTSYSYDAMGNRLSQQSPDTGTTSYVYDTLGNLKSKTDANSDTTTYGYDARNRLEDITYSDSTLNVHYGYNDLGQLVSVTDAAGTATYSYDNRGNVETVAKTMGPITLNTTYGYDDARRMNSITYPSGKRIDYAFDTLGRVTGATQTEGATVTQLAGNIEYKPFGPRTRMDLGNSFQQQKQYDPAYRLKELTMPAGDPVAQLDTDGDGIADGSDNCPFTSNADQQDSGGLNTSVPDGIGDACQCGDVNNDGMVGNIDAILIRRHLLGLPPGIDENKCNVNADTSCTNIDAILIQRAMLGLPPGLTQSCPAAVAGP